MWKLSVCNDLFTISFFLALSALGKDPEDVLANEQGDNDNQYSVIGHETPHTALIKSK